MKNLKYLLTLCLAYFTLESHAQFGFVKKAEIDAVKDTRIVVVLGSDSAYNAAIRAAVQKYWTFNTGYIFAPDTNLKQYMKKPEYTYLIFSKSKGSRIKAKVCSAEMDINGVLLAKNFKRKVPKDDMIAIGFCGNQIDTPDWLPELFRGVQMLDFYLNYAITGKDDRAISESFMTNNYPTDKAVLSSVTLLYEKKLLDIKPTEEAATLWDGEVDELIDKDAIYEAILNQDQQKAYFLAVIDEKVCNKMVISAKGSELMYFTTADRERCTLTAKDLKNLKNIKEKAGKL